MLTTYRARKVSDKLSQEIKDLVPNPEAYEHDMDLREEKEKQRTSLIQVREISMRDENFGNKIQSALTNFGLSIPPVSRLEARASRSKSATTTGGYRSASTSVYSTATGGINSRGDTSGGDFMSFFKIFFIGTFGFHEFSFNFLRLLQTRPRLRFGGSYGSWSN